MQVLWADKHRPRSLRDCEYHKEINQTLSELAKTHNFPHMIFYGPDGAGKKTRVINFIQQVFKVSSLSMTEQNKTLKVEVPSKTIEYTIFSSHYHIEISPNDNEYDDRIIVQHVVKQIAQSKQVSQSKDQQKKIKILVINDADRLTKQAQGSLRRTMQKYMSSCRIILVCQNIHKLILPIRSRCINIRIPAFTRLQIKQNLHRIAHNQFMQITDDQLQKVLKMSGRNMRDAISTLECCKSTKLQNDIFHPYMPEIKNVAKLIFQEQSPAQIFKIRSINNDLLVNCIPAPTIIKNLLMEIIAMNKLTDQILMGVINIASDMETTVVQGSKPIMHLECFVAHVMEAALKAKELKQKQNK